MTSPAIELRDVQKSFGNVKIIHDLNLTVAGGERHAIIGPNGAGKSTTFNLISGYIAPTSGNVLLEGEIISGLRPYQINRRGLSRSFQVTNVFANMSVWENIRCAVLWATGHRYAFWKNVDNLPEVRERTAQILQDINLMPRRRRSRRPSHLCRTACPRNRNHRGGRRPRYSARRAYRRHEPRRDRTRRGTDPSPDGRPNAADRRARHERGVWSGRSHFALVYGHIIASGTPDQIRSDPKVKEAYLGEEAA